jgi:hypothetical protein
LRKGVGDGAEYGMVLPAGIRAAFKVIEAEFGLEFLILLLGRALRYDGDGQNLKLTGPTLLEMSHYPLARFSASSWLNENPSASVSLRYSVPPC